MDVAGLDQQRKDLLNRMVAISALEHSMDPAERARYLQAAQAYQRAEDAYQRAASLLTTEELAAVTARTTR